MSTPTTHDPRFVNTRDGVCWERRTVTDSGLGLYAVEGSCTCPEFKMATFVELAAHGIVEWADVLPMPVGPVPQLSVAEQVSAEIARFGIFGAALPAVKALVKRADELVTENAGLRARVAALLAERHSTNEALSKADEALRADRDGPALPWAAAMDDGDLSMFLNDLVSAAMGRWRSEPEVPDRETLADIEKVCADWRTPGVGYRSDAEPEAVPAPSERPVNELTTVYMPVAAYREDPHDSPLHHDYRVGHDLPELGGAL